MATVLARTPARVERPAEDRVKRVSLTPRRALLLPLGFTLALILVGLAPAARQNLRLLWSFWGASAALLVWIIALLIRTSSRPRHLLLEIVLRKQHYLQAGAQGSVLLYWGWHWPLVYDSVHLIAAQLLFAYAFDMLLVWSRRDSYTLGFGQFPVIFSINLFLWFKPDWFYLQFLMIGVGFTAKELIRWNKEGRPGHIFNPSSFPLAVASVALILSGTTRTTWGEEIATTQFFPPPMYLMLSSVAGSSLSISSVTTSSIAHLIAE